MGFKWKEMLFVMMRIEEVVIKNIIIFYLFKFLHRKTLFLENNLKNWSLQKKLFENSRLSLSKLHAPKSCKNKVIHVTK